MRSHSCGNGHAGRAQVRRHTCTHSEARRERQPAEQPLTWRPTSLTFRRIRWTGRWSISSSTRSRRPTPNHPNTRQHFFFRSKERNQPQRLSFRHRQNHRSIDQSSANFAEFDEISRQVPHALTVCSSVLAGSRRWAGSGQWAAAGGRRLRGRILTHSLTSSHTHNTPACLLIAAHSRCAWEGHFGRRKLDLAVSHSLSHTVSQSLTHSHSQRVAFIHSLTHSAGCCCFFAATSHTLYLQSGLYCSTLPHILGMTNDETLVIDYIEDGLTASSEKRCGNAESNRGGCLYTQTLSDGWSLKHPLWTILGMAYTSTKCDTGAHPAPPDQCNGLLTCSVGLYGKASP